MIDSVFFVNFIHLKTPTQQPKFQAKISTVHQPHCKLSHQSIDLIFIFEILNKSDSIYLTATCQPDKIWLLKHFINKVSQQT